jgi:cytochrome c oxidase subunit I+III
MAGTHAAAAGLSGAPTAIDAARLPHLGWGPGAAVWWAIWSLIAIEGTVFVLLVSVDLYLRAIATAWPPEAIPLPGLAVATANVVLLLVSVVPTVAAHRAALRCDRRASARYLAMATALTLGTLALRGLELARLPMRWDGHAYGSIVWTILGAHAMHLVASALEDLLLCALLVIGPVEDKHYVDVTVSALYWYFVVAAWIPLYLLVYWLPRWS